MTSILESVTTLVASPRVERARRAMADKNLPALLITNRDNVGWISGFTGSNGFVLLTPDRVLFATDSRYWTQADRECGGFEQVRLATSAPEEITEVLASLQTNAVGFESAHLTHRMHQVYREKLPGHIDFVPTDRLIDDLRLVKDAEEIAHIEVACGIADRAWSHIQSFLKPGAVERDVMLELEWYMRKQERAEVAFDTIIASGPRSALPHGRAAERVMERGDFVTLDFGARLNGYNSDITRTVVLGEPTAEQRKVYDTVHEALDRSIAAIKPGATGKEVDAVARDFIKEAGYGDYFGHGLGHSLGRAVHDGPGLSTRSDIILAAGMVMTVEPGIYIPEWGGVRIEHDVLVSEGGNRVLTYSSLNACAYRGARAPRLTRCPAPRRTAPAPARPEPRTQ
jgi:Xaa-Pro aminopeptidase